ncbi:AaceriAEL203Wp [[Ashbya] aceris (nom. inval.)]|nr:AaceriAEL203Wp [[Ashbya] aceris (nom. inval.)]
MLKALIPARAVLYTGWTISTPSRIVARAKSSKVSCRGDVKGGRRSKQKDKGKGGSIMQADLDKLKATGRLYWTRSRGAVRNIMRRRLTASSIIYMVNKSRLPVTTQLLKAPAHGNTSTQVNRRGRQPVKGDHSPNCVENAMFPVGERPIDGGEARHKQSDSRNGPDSEIHGGRQPIGGDSEWASVLLQIAPSLEHGYRCYDNRRLAPAQDTVTGAVMRAATTYEGSRNHLLQLIPTLQGDQNMFEIEMDNLTISLCKKVHDATGIPWKHHLCNVRLPLFIYGSQSPRARLDFQRFLRRSIKAHVQPLLSVLSEKRSLPATRLGAAAAQEIDILVDYLSSQIPGIRPTQCKAACLIHEGPVASFGRMFWLRPSLREWILRKRWRTRAYTAYSRRIKSKDSRLLSLATFQSALYASTLA